MLKITDQGVEGTPPDRLNLIKSRPIIGKMALRTTRWLRAINSERYTGNGERHLDIGCGDGYFLFRSKYHERYGLDKLMGDADLVTDRLDFPDGFFDLVTMLAVIEHVTDPEPMITEIHRVLKPGGKFVITTPKRSAEWIIGLYAPHIDDEHEVYYDHETLGRLVAGKFKINGHHNFIFGLNQAFCMEKI